MNIIDLFILAAITYALYRGYKKGLMASFGKLIGYFCGLAAAAFLSGPLAGWLDDTFNLIKGVTPWLTEQLALPAAAGTARISQVPFDKAVKMINDQQVPVVFKNIMLKYIEDVTKMPAVRGIDNLGEAIAYLVGTFLLTALTFLFVYGVTSLVVGRGIPMFLKKAGPRPVNLFDHMAGAVLGAAGTAIGIAVTLAVLMPLFSIGLIKGQGSVLAAFAVLFQNSKIANIFMQSILQLIA